MDDGLSANDEDDQERGLREEKDCLNLPNSVLMFKWAPIPRMLSPKFTGQILASFKVQLGPPRLLQDSAPPSQSPPLDVCALSPPPPPPRLSEP